MPVGPIGSVIYANQLTTLQASKQGDYQNRVDIQNAAAVAMLNEKEDEVQEVRAPEETYRIDPENEHEKQKKDEENGAKEEQIRLEKHEHQEEENEPPHLGLLDVKA
ncbi:MAG: hypothetical protein PHN18_08255 [Sulfurospirillaceae bacterium]|nr:hypothetical protein [Sulfurospirillaceae bacterium]MDD2826895.1 hypothetical protein [Sulfurospirillaceae bacterium]